MVVMNNRMSRGLPNREVMLVAREIDKQLSVPLMRRELLVLGMAKDSRKWVRCVKG